MNIAAIRRMIFAASLACAASAHATDIRKCVGTDGQVTLTDEVCPAGSRLAKVISAPAAEADAAPAAAAVAAPLAAPLKAQAGDNFAWTRTPVRYVNNVRTNNAARKASLDGETLRAARMHLRLGDTLRSQRMASLQ